MSDEKQSNRSEADNLGKLLDNISGALPVEQIGNEVAETIGGVLSELDRAATKTLDDISRGLAEDEAEFQRRRREGGG